MDLPNVLERPGCGLRFADLPGGDPAVVFLHGAGADHVMFEAQATALAEAGRRVVLLDLRGHGLSQPNSAPLTADLLVEDIEALIATLAVDRRPHRPLGGNLARRSPPGPKYRALGVLDRHGHRTALGVGASCTASGASLADPGPRVMARASRTPFASHAGGRFRR